MKWIVVTSPSLCEGEAGFIDMLVRCGVDVVHLRKPEAGVQQCARLIEQLDMDTRKHIAIHYMPQLAMRYGLGGIHLSGTATEVPDGWQGRVSKSCHTMLEVQQYKDRYDYVFLSPVFNSISKQGYHAAFSYADIVEASRRGIVSGKVIALGGVTEHNVPDIKAWGFGGAAMLGSISGLMSLPEDEAAGRLMAIRRMMDSL